MKRLICLSLATFYCLCSFARGVSTSGHTVAHGPRGSHSTSISHVSGGHGGAHAYHGYRGYIYTDHNASEIDAFAELRTKIYTGFIVMGVDTMRGIMTCSDNTLSIKTDPYQDSTFTYSMADTNLRYAEIQDNGKTMNMVRQNKKLYRVLHTGSKLSVYDTYFSFDYDSKEFYGADSWVVFPDHGEVLNGFWTMSVKRKLVDDINKAYGSKLDPKDFDKKELLNYMKTLD